MTTFRNRHVVLALMIGVVLGLLAARGLGHHGHGSPARRMDRLARKLELTGEQRAKIEQLFEKGARNIDDERLKTREEIRQVLTDAQRAKFDEIMARHDARHHPDMKGGRPK